MCFTIEQNATFPIRGKVLATSGLDGILRRRHHSGWEYIRLPRWECVPRRRVWGAGLG